MKVVRLSALNTGRLSGIYLTYTSQGKSNFMKVDVYFEIKLLIFEQTVNISDLTM
jgi:hypothetical protein